MFGPEHILCWFRRQPFSIRMKWQDEDLKYLESVYVAGQPGDKVRFVTRWWVPPLLPPPGINRVDLQTPVVWGESKRPLTDFGLERLMEQSVESLDAAGENVVVTYEGLREQNVPLTLEACQRIYLMEKGMVRHQATAAALRADAAAIHQYMGV